MHEWGLQGGLAGLLLRLRQDGHGQLAAFGPAGIAAHARALRHLIRWRHPALKVCEVEPLDPPVIYKVRLHSLQSCPLCIGSHMHI